MTGIVHHAVSTVPTIRTGSAPDDPTVKLSLLDATVTRAGRTFGLSGRELELVYSIALRGRPVARATLIEDIWPNVEEDAAINAFNVSLHRLRKRLGRRDSVCLTAHGYRIAPDFTTDLHALEMLEKHLAGRPALSDHDAELLSAAHRRLSLAVVPTQLTDTEAGRMLDETIEYLKRGFSKQLATLALQLDQTTRALEIAREMIRVDGCDECAWSIVIRVHLAQNDRGSAIRDFRTYARNLANELGLQPSRSIQQLIDRCEGTAPRIHAIKSA